MRKLSPNESAAAGHNNYFFIKQRDFQKNDDIASSAYLEILEQYALIKFPEHRFDNCALEIFFYAFIQCLAIYLKRLINCMFRCSKLIFFCRSSKNK